MAKVEILVCDNCEKVIEETMKPEYIIVGADPYQMNVWMGDVGAHLLAPHGQDATFCTYQCFQKWVKQFRADALAEKEADNG